MIWLLAGAALAGQSPWALDAGEHNVFVGVDGSSFERVGTTGSPTTLGSPVTSVQLTAVYTVGLRDDLDLEVLLPVRSVWAPAAEGAFCTDGRPDDWCATTTGVGDLSAQLRFQLLDEEDFRPVTVSTQLSVSTGALYGPTRSRLTTLGDGSTDLGLGVAIGRTGTWKSSWYRVSGGAAYRYRFGLARVDGRKAPADEVSFDGSFMASPIAEVGVGAAISGFHRLGGLPLSEVDIDGENAWISLAATHLRAGPQVAVYTRDHLTVYGALNLSIAARNTPSDLWSVTVGLGRYIDRRGR